MFSLKSRKKEKAEEKEKKKISKMEDLDDLDFNGTPVKRSETRAGRKQDDSVGFINDFSTEIGNNSSQAPVRARKTAGWADDNVGKKNWLRRGSKNLLKESPKKEVVIDSSPVNNEIPIIPDLDDIKEDEISADVAKAPSLNMSRIATYQELDTDLSKHAAFQSLDGIDLTILTKRLLPESLVKKEDETPWTYDTLFADVSSHLNAFTAQNQEVSLTDKNSSFLNKFSNLHI